MMKILLYDTEFEVQNKNKNSQKVFYEGYVTLPCSVQNKNIS